MLRLAQAKAFDLGRARGKVKALAATQRARMWPKGAGVGNVVGAEVGAVYTHTHQIHGFVHAHVRQRVQ